jgi:predicted ester cyclase
MTQLSDNKAIVRRHLEEAVSGKRPELWNEIMAEDFVLHHPLLQAGRSNYADAVATLWAGFPDLHEEVLDLVAEDDRVVARYVERGTHTGRFLGLAPTGRAYAKHGFVLYRMANGQLAEAWIQEDDQGYQQQLFG